MNNITEHLMKNITKNRILSDAEFQKCITDINLKFPPDYLEFMRMTNGGEGFLSDGFYIMLWRFEDLIEFNKMYNVKEFAPNLFLIGSDGSDTAFGLQKSNSNFVEVPFIGLSDNEAVAKGENFVDLLNSLVK